MISALYNLSLPVFNEEWHPWDNIVGRRPGGPIRDGTAGVVPGAPASLTYKVLIKDYSVLNVCFDRWDHAILQSFLSWRDTTHRLVWEGMLLTYEEYRPEFLRLGLSDAAPLTELKMPWPPVWMVTLLTPNLWMLKEFPNQRDLIEILNNLEISVAWTVLTDYAADLL
jgi:hypothetical protein